ncbi:PH domain-containing protein [Nocardia speluncae]|uniref:PH domain-containing protein n=1 Tax=Nocardia speluncae TaxID=419477 RepID=A0A846XDZ3_9NOCA|nr:PH domain-containing protein [Nocardia speluncae]NKY34162.1 PH domain-containing protein [Nocardia speluncae]
MSDAAEDRPTAAPDTGAPPGVTTGEGPWLRLDRRMLLVHPVQAIMKFFPAVIGGALLGIGSGNPLWGLLAPIIVVPYGLALWFTTTYRMSPTHVELRTGVIQRKRLSVPRARIRSVDIEADPLHRILGLAAVVLGTGQEAGADDRFTLDALAADQVRPLRTELLAHTRRPHISADGPGASALDPKPTGADSGHTRAVTGDGIDSAADRGTDTAVGREIGHWRAEWVRYAPLSLTGFALAASAIGIAAQFGLGSTEIRVDRETVDTVRGVGVAALIILGVLFLAVLVVVVSVAACAHYLITYFGLRVTDYGSTLQVRRGLFTLRQITLDTARLRGATIIEPLLLRSAGAAQLEAIMTGENPRQKILPQSPRPAVERTLADLLRPRRDQHDPDPAALQHLQAPARVRLTQHGPAARRRRHIRAGWPAPLLLVALAIPTAAGWQVAAWWWLIPVALIPIGALLAEDRYRGLGHAVLPAESGAPTWLVVRSGSLDRERSCLEAPGIIGWTVRQTFWQRRAGLATLSAATAAGKKVYSIPDIPLDQVRPLIEKVTPDL